MAARLDGAHVRAAVARGTYLDLGQRQLLAALSNPRAQVVPNCSPCRLPSALAYAPSHIPALARMGSLSRGLWLCRGGSLLAVGDEAVKLRDVPAQRDVVDLQMVGELADTASLVDRKGQLLPGRRSQRADVDASHDDLRARCDRDDRNRLSLVQLADRRAAMCHQRHDAAEAQPLRTPLDVPHGRGGEAEAPGAQLQAGAAAVRAQPARRAPRLDRVPALDPADHARGTRPRT